MSDLQIAVVKLMSSPHYKELAAYEPPFNPFEIAGVTYRELTHSSVLAWLLRDEENREFRQRFVAWIRNRIVAEAEKTNDDWDKFVVPKNPEDPSLKPKIVKTEEGDKTSRVDVFAHFESLKLVIGIEVKIWADEQPDQVKRYQDLLCQNNYHDYTKAVVFLTPTGWEPKTAYENNVDVPVLTMSWSYVSEIIKETQSASGDKNNFRMQFLQHLDRNIVMNETEEQRMVRELLSEDDNLEIINKITRKMKTWDDKGVIEGEIYKFNVEMVQKIINNISSLRTSLECEFWREFGEQLREQLQLQDEELEFQSYKSDDLKPEVIEDKRLYEYIKWGYGGSPGLTFRISGSSLDDYEVACRITYDTAPVSHIYYGFVLCKKDNLRERIKIKNDDEYHKKCDDLLGGKILDRGPDKEHGWLRWKMRANVNIYFANGPALFDTLVDIKKRKKEIVNELVREICEIIKIIPKDKAIS